MTTEIDTVSPALISLAVADKTVLQANYLPFVKNGGLFIPSQQDHILGEEFLLVVNLIEEQDQFSVKVKVIWITPKEAQGNKVSGIGVQFQEEVGCMLGRDRI